jgi:hypothetical protein
MASYTDLTPTIGPPLGTPAAWKAWARANGVQRIEAFDQYVDEIYRLCALYPAPAHLIICQMLHETGGGTSDAWTICLNPAGIGVTSSAQRLWYTFRDGVDAARGHWYHYLLYTVKPIPDVAVQYRSHDPRASAVSPSWQGQRQTLRSFGSADPKTYPTWAVDVAYGEKWAKWLNATARVFEEVAPVAEYPVNWPGLPGGPISFSFPVYLNIVPAWRTGQRSGIKARAPRQSVQHENGNQNSGARADSMYLYNGAEGRSASWHGSVDHKEGYANLPADEVGWQASDGSGPGNMNGFAVELCQLSYRTSPEAWRQARRNAAEMMGRISARIGAGPPPKQHNTFAPDGKNCPQFLRSNATWWREYVSDWTAFNADEKARMGLEPPEDPSIINVGDTLRALVPLNFRQAATVSAPVIATLPVGAEMVVSGLWSSADGYGWLPVRHTLPSGTAEGYVAQGNADGPFIEIARRADKPPVDPTYAKKLPIEALLETDLKKYDTAVGIVTDDATDFVFVADVIEFTDVTVAGQHAGSNPPAVRAPYGIGDRAIAAWVFKNYAGTWYYLLAGGDDEWVRVPFRNTRRVSDAPLLPGDEE